MIPINILINRKPEHNHESSRSRRKRKEAQRVRQQKKWSKLTRKVTIVEMEMVCLETETHTQIHPTLFHRKTNAIQCVAII